MFFLIQVNFRQWEGKTVLAHFVQNPSYLSDFDWHEMNLKLNSFSYEWFRTKTRFDTRFEAKWPIHLS